MPTPDDGRGAAERIAALERELADRDRRMQLALDTARLLVYTWDLATGAIEGRTFRGSAFDAAAGSGAYRTTHAERLAHVHPDDRDRFAAALGEAVAAGRDDYRFEFRLDPGHGDDRWYEHRGRVVRDAAGRAVRAECVSFEVTERVRRERELREALALRQQFSRRLESARDEERRALARRLHDDLAQGLTAMALHLELLLDPAPGDDPAARGRDLKQLTGELLDVVRQLSVELRPPLLDELGLVPALQAYLGMQRAQYGIAFELRADERAPRAPAELESAAFRILQEAIVNASRHSGAGRITVTAEWRDGGLALCVADDGRGFDVGDEIRRDAVGAHLGLLRLRERTDELGGRLRIESAPGRGTTVDAWLPCAERA